MNWQRQEGQTAPIPKDAEHSLLFLGFGATPHIDFRMSIANSFKNTGMYFEVGVAMEGEGLVFKMGVVFCVASMP